MAAAAHAEAAAGIDSAAAHAYNTGQLVAAWTHNVGDLQQRMTIAEERLRLTEARIAGHAVAEKRRCNPKRSDSKGGRKGASLSLQRCDCQAC